jgi:hypothetical protein
MATKKDEAPDVMGPEGTMKAGDASLAEPASPEAGDPRPMAEGAYTFDEVQRKGYYGQVTEESERQQADASIRGGK